MDSLCFWGYHSLLLLGIEMTLHLRSNDELGQFGHGNDAQKTNPNSKRQTKDSTSIDLNKQKKGNE